jgi:hypothetical protein
VILGFLAILFGWAAGAAGHVNVVPGRAVRLVVQQAE